MSTAAEKHMEELDKAIASLLEKDTAKALEETVNQLESIASNQAKSLFEAVGKKIADPVFQSLKVEIDKRTAETRLDATIAFLSLIGKPGTQSLITELTHLTEAFFDLITDEVLQKNFLAIVDFCNNRIDDLRKLKSSDRSDRTGK